MGWSEFSLLMAEFVVFGFHPQFRENAFSQATTDVIEAVFISEKARAFWPASRKADHGQVLLKSSIANPPGAFINPRLFS